MGVKFAFIVFLLVTYQIVVDCSIGDKNSELCEFFKFLSLDQFDLCRNTRKVSFLEKKIEIPDGVSDVVAFEIQKILNDYENRMLNLAQELISCDGPSTQYEKYLRSYKQLKEIESSLREAPKILKQKFVNQADFHSKNSKLFFDVFQIFSHALDIINDVSVLFNFQVNVMKPGKPPSTDSSSNEKPDKPDDKPDKKPDDKPDEKTTDEPTDKPDEKPTDEPTDEPTDKPTEKPTEEPSKRKPGNQKRREDEFVYDGSGDNK